MAKKKNEEVEVVEPTNDVTLTEIPCVDEDFFVNDVLDIDEAASYLRIGKATIKSLVKEKAIPFKQINEHKFIFARRALEEWVYKGK